MKLVHDVGISPLLAHRRPTVGKVGGPRVARRRAFADVEPTLARWPNRRRADHNSRRRADHDADVGPTLGRRRHVIWVLMKS